MRENSDPLSDSTITGQGHAGAVVIRAQKSVSRIIVKASLVIGIFVVAVVGTDMAGFKLGGLGVALLGVVVMGIIGYSRRG
jgi:hypothetical protein